MVLLIGLMTVVSIIIGTILVIMDSVFYFFWATIIISQCSFLGVVFSKLSLRFEVNPVVSRIAVPPYILLSVLRGFVFSSISGCMDVADVVPVSSLFLYV